jgi:hypothetical protein
VVRSVDQYQRNHEAHDTHEKWSNDNGHCLLAFIGHRYGWVPPTIPADATEKYAFIIKFPGVSVTELKMRQGAMLDPALAGFAAANHHALLRRRRT